MMFVALQNATSRNNNFTTSPNTKLKSRHNKISEKSEKMGDQKGKVGLFHQLFKNRPFFNRWKVRLWLKNVDLGCQFSRSKSAKFSHQSPRNAKPKYIVKLALNNIYSIPPFWRFRVSIFPVKKCKILPYFTQFYKTQIYCQTSVK